MASIHTKITYTYVAVVFRLTTRYQVRAPSPRRWGKTCAFLIPALKASRRESMCLRHSRRTGLKIGCSGDLVIKTSEKLWNKVHSRLGIDRLHKMLQAEVCSAVVLFVELPLPHSYLCTIGSPTLQLSMGVKENKWIVMVWPDYIQFVELSLPHSFISELH